MPVIVRAVNLDERQTEGEDGDKPPGHVTRLGGIPVDLDFIKSYCGILELVICILSLIAFICSETGGYCYFVGANVSYFASISCSTFLTMLLWWLFYVVTLVERLRLVPWRIWELIILAVFGVLYIIADIMIVAMPCNVAAYKAAGAFSFFSVFAMCVHFYLSLQIYKTTERPQLTRQSAHCATAVVL